MQPDCINRRPATKSCQRHQNTASEDDHERRVIVTKLGKVNCRKKHRHDQGTGKSAGPFHDGRQHETAEENFFRDRRDDDDRHKRNRIPYHRAFGEKKRRRQIRNERIDPFKLPCDHRHPEKNKSERHPARLWKAPCERLTHLLFAKPDKNKNGNRKRCLQNQRV